MAAPLWIGIIATFVLLGFLLNGVRLARGPEGHAANAGKLQITLTVMVLPVIWVVVAGMSL